MPLLRPDKTFRYAGASVYIVKNDSYSLSLAISGDARSVFNIPQTVPNDKGKNKFIE